MQEIKVKQSSIKGTQLKANINSVNLLTCSILTLPDRVTPGLGGLVCSPQPLLIDIKNLKIDKEDKSTYDNHKLINQEPNQLTKRINPITGTRIN